jgi:chromate transporter
VAGGALVLYLLGIPEILLLAGGALGVMLVNGVRQRWGRETAAFAPLGVPLGLLAVPPATTGLIPLFLSFLKIGSILFGSGYALLASLRSEFVRPGMLTQHQLVDAVAVGQITPGPVFTTATFIGYLLEGVPGAIIATVGIFLPAFVIFTGSIIPRLRSSPIFSSFLDGVNAVSLALMAGVT